MLYFLFARSLFNIIFINLHSLGGTANVPHGYTSCINLPHVLEYNSHHPDMDKKLKIVSECFGQQNVHAAIVVDEYVRKLGLPRSLEEVGVKPDMHETIAKLSMHDFMFQTVKKWNILPSRKSPPEVNKFASPL